MTQDEYFKEAFKHVNYLINGLCKQRFLLYHDAESVVLETVQMVAKNCETIKASFLLAYLTQAVRWRASNTYRRRYNKDSQRMTDVSDINEPFKSCPDTEAESRDMLEFIEKIIDELPERDASVVRAIANGGTYQEAADTHNISRERVRQILNYRSKHLSRRLRAQGVNV